MRLIKYDGSKEKDTTTPVSRGGSSGDYSEGSSASLDRVIWG